MKVNASQIHKAELESNIYFICGSSSSWFLYANSMLKQIKGYTSTMTVDPTNFVGWSDLISEITSADLFNQKIIEIELSKFRLDKSANQALGSITSSTDNSNIVIFLYNKPISSIQKQDWFKLIVKDHVCISCFDLDLDNYVAWCRDIFLSKGMSISTELAHYIALDNYGMPGNVVNCSNSIATLNLPKKIELEDVQDLIFSSSDNNAFTLVNSIIHGNKNLFLQMFNNLQEDSIPSYVVLWALAKEIRSLFDYSLTQDKSQLSFSINKSSNSRLQELIKIEQKDLAILLKKCSDIDMVIKGLAAGNAWEMLLSIGLYLLGCTSIKPIINTPKEEFAI